MTSTETDEDEGGEIVDAQQRGQRIRSAESVESASPLIPSPTFVTDQSAGTRGGRVSM
jgi:hypothetical protein